LPRSHEFVGDSYDSSPSRSLLVTVIAVRIMMRAVVAMMVVLVAVMIIVVVMVAVVVLRLVILIIILVSFRHRTESSSDTERKKGNKGGFHILSEYGCCETLGRV
jgi:hypothetical protein